MKITIKEVALLAGVSPITASRAINNPNIVSSDTVAKVKAAIKQLGYQPSPIAKRLRTGKTSVITLVVKQKEAYDPLLFEFSAGVSEICREQGYSLLIYLSDGSDKLSDLVGKTDGLILTDVVDHDERIEELQSVLPVAVFGRTECEIPQIDVDNYWGAKVATEYLHTKGYKDVVLLTGNARYLFLKHREDGYLSATNQAGYLPRIKYGSFDVRGGNESMKAAFQSSDPDAVLCASDAMAIGALRYLNQENIQLPIIGYDGGYLTDVPFPALTSVKQPFFEVGKRLAQGLFEYIRTGTVTIDLVKPELVVKGSA